MVRLSNGLVGILNFVIVLISIAILGAGIWLSTKSSTVCEQFLQKPLIVLGVFLLLVSLAGFVGACCKNSLLMWIYLFVMFLLIVLVFCFTIFAFVVTNKGAGEVVSGRGFKEYKLADYSNWLQNTVLSSSNWDKIKSCLQEGKVCDSLVNKQEAYAAFYNENLSPIQSGCCKPPSACNYQYVSPTNWIANSTSTASADTDCGLWNNNSTALCFSCNSCKAGVLANVKDNWKKVAIVNIIFLVFLIIVYSVGCCAFRNNRSDYSYPRYKGGYA